MAARLAVLFILLAGFLSVLIVQPTEIFAQANDELELDELDDEDDEDDDEDELDEDDGDSLDDDELDDEGDELDELDDDEDDEDEDEEDSDDDAEQIHAKVYGDADLYPSASDCAKCHPVQYEEWRSSAHAYASISPMFHKFEQAINTLSQGTIGTFCVRCHATVGTTLGEPRELPIWDRSPVSREGITCVTCHRINEAYGKVNGERRVVPGKIFDAMYGPFGGEGVEKAIAQKDFLKISTNSSDPGAKIHLTGVKFKQMSESEFCVGCHQVAVHPGIKLEIVWDQFRASPALKEGTTCQDCHMSPKPGQNAPYARGPETPVAVVNGKVPRPNQPHANHAFVGPGYPIAHPGIFPHHPDNEKFEILDWLKFNYREKWGSPEFEKKVASGKISPDFPEEWESLDDREDAWKVVSSNLEKIEEKARLRSELMEAGSKIDGPFFADSPEVGDSLDFHYVITNLNNGHNLPSGSLGAQPEIWLNVALIDPDGLNVWESGYVDSNGDFADLHSLDVAKGLIEHDDQLFNLQTKFLTTNVKGTDREMYLPVNFDIDQIPFIRPANVPTTVLNHPPFIRMENRSIPPLGKRKAKYSVPSRLINKPGTWRLAVRMRSRAEPIYFMRFVGATSDMEQAMNEWMLDVHPYSVEFQVK